MNNVYILVQGLFILTRVSGDIQHWSPPNNNLRWMIWWWPTDMIILRLSSLCYEFSWQWREPCMVNICVGLNCSVWKRWENICLLWFVIVYVVYTWEMCCATDPFLEKLLAAHILSAFTHPSVGSHFNAFETDTIFAFIEAINSNMHTTYTRFSKKSMQQLTWIRAMVWRKYLRHKLRTYNENRKSFEM